VTTEDLDEAVLNGLRNVVGLLGHLTEFACNLNFGVDECFGDIA
jgi:hypothetical protein